MTEFYEEELPIGEALLRRKGIVVECAASHLNSLCQRVEAGKADVADFTIAQADYEMARDDFRETLANVTGQSAAWVERVLSL
jgi:hypothetical protein